MADSALTFDIFARDHASAAFSKVGRSADDTHDRLRHLTDGLGDVGTRMSKVMTIAGAVGPGVMAVGAALSSAAAGGVAVAGALGPAAAAGLAAYGGALLAVKSATLVTTFAMGGLTDAVGGDAEAMAKLSPAGQSFARTLTALKPRLDAVRTSVQNGMFPGLENATDRLATAYFPLLKKAAYETGSALGDLAVDGSRMVASGPWRKDFGTVARDNAGNIRLMGNAGLSLADAARSLIVTSMPVTRMFLSWATGAAAAVDRFVQVKRESGALDAFWSKAAASGATLGHILGNLAVGLFNVFKIGAGGQGTSMLKTLEGITAQFRAWTTSSSGISKISGWFADGRKNLDAMGRLIGSVSKGLAGMGSGKQLAPLIDQIRTKVIPPLMQFLQNASASGALNSLVDAVGKVIQVFADLSKHDGSLKAFATTLGILANAADWIVKHVPGAGAALAAFFAVAGASSALKFVGLGGVVKTLGGALTNLIKPAEEAGTAAKVAGTAAEEAGKGSKIWAAAQWLLNAALDANPIGIVIVAIAALAAGLIYAYKHSATFRAIVQGAFHAVGAAAGAMWGVIKTYFKFIINTWLTVAGALVNGAAKAFGWVPGIGPKLRAAASWFNDFKTRVNAQLNGIHDRNVKVTAHVSGTSAVKGLIQSISGVHNKDVYVTSHATTVGGLLGAHHASGGPVQAGRIYPVNEMGLEGFVPNVNGRIVPASQMGAGPTASVGGDTYVININGALDENATAKKVEQVLAKYKRQHGNVKLAFQ